MINLEFMVTTGLWREGANVKKMNTFSLHITNWYQYLFPIEKHGQKLKVELGEVTFF